MQRIMRWLQRITFWLVGLVLLATIVLIAYVAWASRMYTVGMEFTFAGIAIVVAAASVVSVGLISAALGVVRRRRRMTD